MAEAAVLPRPTTRLEDWRYADPDALAQIDPARLDQWEEMSIAPGESLAQTHLVEPGVTRLRVSVGEGASYALFALNAAGPYARLEVEITLAKAANFTFGGVTIGGGEKVQEFVTRTVHAHPDACSRQVARSVQWGHSVGNFLGRIEVARGAQKSDAAQNFRAILLEKGASANAKPELEIFADDVQCAHGAAIGELDENAGFYLASRGIPPELARKLLVQAFIADAFEAMEDDDERSAMLERALTQLEGASL